MKPRVSIVFLNHNGKKDTLSFLRSVMISDYPKQALETIMVDNGSTDDSAKAVKTHYSKIKIIQIKENLDVPQARNIGIKMAKGIYILSSDNDVILAQDYLTTLVDLMEKNPKIGIMGGMVYKKKPKTKIESTGYGFHFLAANLYDVKNSGETLQERQYLSGCAMLIRQKALKTIGPFDKSLYFFEDTDLCFRARKAGFKVVFTPTTKVFHGKDKSTPYYPKGGYKMWCRSLFGFLFKHTPLLLIPIPILLHLTIIPIGRRFMTIDPRIKVNLIQDYQTRWTAFIWNLRQLKIIPNLKSKND